MVIMSVIKYPDFKFDDYALNVSFKTIEINEACNAELKY